MKNIPCEVYAINIYKTFYPTAEYAVFGVCRKFMKINHMLSGLSNECHVAYKVKNFITPRYIRH